MIADERVAEMLQVKRRLRAVLADSLYRIGPKWVEYSAKEEQCYDALFPRIPIGCNIVAFELDRSVVCVLEQPYQGHGDDLTFTVPRQALQPCRPIAH
jgi:hypothetical protein